MPSATSSDHLHTSQMNYLLKGTAWTPPTTLWVALFTTLPQLDGTGGVEVSRTGTAYGRVSIAQGTGWTGPGASKEYVNANDLTFAVPTANWGTIVGGGLFDAETGGNLLYISQLPTSKVVSNGDGAPKILAGQMRILRATC